MRFTVPFPQLLRRALVTSFGLLVFALGNYLTVKANIGQAAWNVLNMGLSNVLSLTFGQITIFVSGIVILLDILMREPIGLGTILNGLLVGTFYDVFDAMGLVPVIQNPLLGFLVLVVGMVIMAAAHKIYMSPCLGCGPRDTMMVGIGKYLRKVPMGVVSVIISLAVVLAGWLMGGDVGIGTIFYLLCNGFVLQVVYNALRFEPRDLEHLSLLQLVSRKEETAN